MIRKDDVEYETYEEGIGVVKEKRVGYVFNPNFKLNSGSKKKKTQPRQPSEWVKRGGRFAPKKTEWVEQCDDSGCEMVETAVYDLFSD